MQEAAETIDRTGPGVTVEQVKAVCDDSSQRISAMLKGPGWKPLGMVKSQRRSSKGRKVCRYTRVHK